MIRVCYLAIVLTVFPAAGLAQEEPDETQRYLVTMEYVEPGPLLSKDQAVGLVEGMILPFWDALEHLQEEGKLVAGGVPVGSRTATFIIEAESHDALDQLLESMPGWAVFRVDVQPLQAFERRAAQDRQLLERLRAAPQ